MMEPIKPPSEEEIYAFCRQGEDAMVALVSSLIDSDTLFGSPYAHPFLQSRLSPNALTVTGIVK